MSRVVFAPQGIGGPGAATTTAKLSPPPHDHRPLVQLECATPVMAHTSHIYRLGKEGPGAATTIAKHTSGPTLHTPLLQLDCATPVMAHTSHIYPPGKLGVRLQSKQQHNLALPPPPEHTPLVGN